MLFAVLLVLSGALTLHILSTFLRLFVRQALSPLQHLQRPPSPSFFLGNLREMHDQENTNLVDQWKQQYGSTFVYRGFLGGSRLLTTDPVAVAHIMGRGYDFPKPDFVRDNLANMAVGAQGLITVEGEDHRRQRKILTPAFTSSHIRSLSPVFWSKAVMLRDIWLLILSSSQPISSPLDPFHATSTSPSREDLSTRTGAKTSSFLPNPFSSFTPGKVTSRHTTTTGGADNVPPTTHGTARVDVLAWLARATLDVIGEAGFGYSFDSLSLVTVGGKGESELARAFGVIFNSARRFRVMTILHAWFPELRRFRGEGATEREARRTMRDIGLSLIEQRQAEATKEQAASILVDRPHGPPRTQAPEEAALVSSHTTAGRDLLSVLIRSNLSSVPSQRLSLEETLCQISTFLSAGHETSSSALTWTLYALARAPDIQQKLRDELRSIPLPSPHFHPPATATPSPDVFDAIFSHAYLDAVVREALRLHAPVTSTMRAAGVDDVVPVARPFRDRRGRVCTAIRVRKGDIITIPIQAMNKSREVWGEDAEAFRPERWLDDAGEESDAEGGGKGGGGAGSLKTGRGQKRPGAPGLWGNMLTFGNGNPLNGNRACIGYRFAINEIKVFLYVLLHDIEFSIDPTIEIEKKINVVTRPTVKSEPDMGNQLPLILRRVSSQPPDTI